MTTTRDSYAPDPSPLEHASALLGRLLLSVIFLRSLYAKSTGFDAQLEHMHGAGMPGGTLGSFLLAGAMLTMVVGTLMLVLGARARIGALLLIAFLIPTTLIFHLDLDQPGQWIQFGKNLGLVGGLLMVVAHGPGAWALTPHR